MMIDIVQKMSIQIPVEARQMFIYLMTENLDLDQWTSIIRNAMVKHFTVEELQALNNFYSSPIGRSAMKKFFQYMADATPHLKSLMNDALKKVIFQIGYR